MYEPTALLKSRRCQGGLGLLSALPRILHGGCARTFVGPISMLCGLCRLGLDAHGVLCSNRPAASYTPAGHQPRIQLATASVFVRQMCLVLMRGSLHRVSFGCLVRHLGWSLPPSIYTGYSPLPSSDIRTCFLFDSKTWPPPLLLLLLPHLGSRQSPRSSSHAVTNCQRSGCSPRLSCRRFRRRLKIIRTV